MEVHTIGEYYMDKDIAISLLPEEYKIKKSQCHMASVSNASNGDNVHWFTIPKKKFENDVCLFLNNNIDGVLYTLYIKKGDLQLDRLFIKKSNGFYHIEIRCDDESFLDIKSNLSFAKYLVDTYVFTDIYSKD